MKSQVWIVCSCSAAAGPPCRTAGEGAGMEELALAHLAAALCLGEGSRDGPAPGDVFDFQGRNNL